MGTLCISIINGHLSCISVVCRHFLWDSVSPHSIIPKFRSHPSLPDFHTLILRVGCSYLSLWLFQACKGQWYCLVRNQKSYPDLKGDKTLFSVAKMGWNSCLTFHLIWNCCNWVDTSKDPGKGYQEVSQGWDFSEEGSERGRGNSIQDQQGSWHMWRKRISARASQRYR